MPLLAVCLLAIPLLLSSAPEGLRVPIETDRWGRAFVRLHLGAAGPYRFLIDTGSTVSAVSGEIAERLALRDAGRIAIRALGQPGSGRMVHAAGVRIGRRTVPLQRIAIMDKRLDPSGRFDGMLGQDVLGRLDYLLAPGAGVMWIDPPPHVVARLEGAVVPLRAIFAPLSVTDHGRATEWGIDTGASHPVIFRAGLGARTGLYVEITTSTGRHFAERLRPGAVDVGGLLFSWQDAVLYRQFVRPQAGLLPLSMFDALYVSNRTGVVVLAPRGSAKPGRPDVAARFGALEDDASAVGRPGGVPDVAARGAQVGQLPHLSGVRRD